MVNKRIDKVKKIAFGGLFAAVIMIATGFLKIPTALGYFNLGDGFIFIAAAFLGPWALLPAAIGSALADLVAGYLVYIPVTAIIKGLMAVLVGMVWQHTQKKVLVLLSLVLAEAIMIFGYFVFESILYGTAAAAAVLLSNSIQGLVGIFIGMTGVFAVGHKFDKYLL